MLKKRIQFIELQDLSITPNAVREGVTDYLSFVHKELGFYQPVVPLIIKTLTRTQNKNIIDLCSGGGGPLPGLYNSLKIGMEHDCKILLTDLYPNIQTFDFYKKSYPECFDYISESIDATNVTSKLKGMRTLFTSFHHFPDEKAKLILKDAFDKKEPIGVFEFTKREWFTFFMVLPAAFLMLFFTPLVRPFKVSRLFFTYLLPLIPLVTLWDILVTVLRTRNPEELKELTQELTSEEYDWEIGEIKTSLMFTLTYLIGSPVNSKNKEDNFSQVDSDKA